MTTEREAFTCCLYKFSNLSARKEIEEKSITCIRGLLKLGLEDGNCLKESWEQVLQTVSRIDYFISRAHGTAHDGDMDEVPRRENSAIMELNCQKVAESIDESDLDKIVSRSNRLDEDSIVEFTNCLCKVSENELCDVDNPQTFSL